MGRIQRLIRYIVNQLNFYYGVTAPCRTTRTVCGLLPCIKN